MTKQEDVRHTFVVAGGSATLAAFAALDEMPMATIPETGESIAVMQSLAYLVARDAMRDGTNPTETLSRFADALRGSNAASAATVDAVAGAAEEHLVRILRIAEALIAAWTRADDPTDAVGGAPPANDDERDAF